jgi:hypothetical protein
MRYNEFVLPLCFSFRFLTPVYSPSLLIPIKIKTIIIKQSVMTKSYLPAVSELILDTFLNDSQKLAYAYA